MIVSLLFFKLMVWGSIIVSGVLMITIFAYFIYELKQKQIW
ncbi:hypothetical protein AB4Y30_15690 [Ornithinibacillus sp. 4-3]|uniref:Uncharacterized protein n=1 Tax=Ornithinibacillus sp. 4-3 TaxID=3231488 RepID=A0AB39HRN0_9BACI